MRAITSTSHVMSPIIPFCLSWVLQLSQFVPSFSNFSPFLHCETYHDASQSVMKHILFPLWTVTLPLPVGSFSLLRCLDPLLTPFPNSHPVENAIHWTRPVVCHSPCCHYHVSIVTGLTTMLLIATEVTWWFCRRTFAIITRIITFSEVLREVAPEKKLRRLLDYLFHFSPLLNGDT